MEKLRVIVVDDELAARTNATELLRRIPDCELVGTAENGRQALELARAIHPQVVLADVSMPGMSGLELVRALKAEQPEIQVIMLTMYSDFEYAVSAFRDGAADYVLKDAYDITALSRALEKARGRLVQSGEEEAAKSSYRLEKQIRDCAWRGRSGRLIQLLSPKEVTLSGQYSLLMRCGFEECIPVENGLWLAIGRGEGLAKGACCYSEISDASDSALEVFRRRMREAFYFPMIGELTGAEYDSTFPGELRSRLIRRFRVFFSGTEEDFPGDYVAECIERHVSPDQMKAILIACLRDMYSPDMNEAAAMIRQADSAQKAALLLRTAQLKWRLGGEARAREPVERLKEYIQEHLAEPLSLNSLSEQAGFSAAYLSALFKSETGEGIKQYIIRARLERAAELLRSTNDRIYEIAEKCGFESTRHFSETFSRAYGMTPKKYRGRE